MNRSDFFYELPLEQIAQHPADPRDSSRLLCLDRETGESSERIFCDIPALLRCGDLLVVNNSRVIPARLLGNKADTGAAIEVLLLRDRALDYGAGCWECLVKPGRRLHAGARMVFGEQQQLTGEILTEIEGGNRIVCFTHNAPGGFFALIDQLGTLPLPHYITAPLAEKASYQTVYAEIDGSAAAPTAGFHFTDRLLREIKAMGVGIAPVTLHVGLGTFRPVKENDITRHLMHREYYSVPANTAAQIEQTKANGGRVIAVGTTSCRTLEATAQKHGRVIACEDSTDIFIYPGYQFKAIDALITNFHLPESTLIMLVSAFAGYENTMRAYQKAVADNFRFFSFGDAMFIY